MSYSVRDSRPGAGEALRREERPARTTWRWVTVTSLAIAVLLSAWALGPGGYVARTAAPDLTPVATVTSLGGRADARLGAGTAWAPLNRGDVLRAGADVRTTSAGAITLVTSDGAEVHVDANSRIDVPDARTIRFQFGSIEVDTRAQQGPGGGITLDVALTETRLGGSALFTVTRHARSAEVRVLDGRVLVNGGGALDAGACGAIPHRYVPGLEVLAVCH